MYIPTQQERYRKVAQITLFLCVIVPSGIVYWLSGIHQFLECLTAFLWPLAGLLELLGLKSSGALIVSGGIQAVAFFWLARLSPWSPKVRLTIAITWGMSFALALRLMVAYSLWRQITGR